MVDRLSRNLLLLQLEPEGVHILDGLCHRSKILLGQPLQRRAQDIVDDGWLEVTGQLRCTKLDQKVQHLPIGVGRREAEKLLVHELDIVRLTIIDPSALREAVLQLLPGQGELLCATAIERKIDADTSAIEDTEIPLVQRLSTACPDAHTDREVGFTLLTLKLHIEIAGPLLPLIALLQEIPRHLSVT